MKTFSSLELVSLENLEGAYKKARENI